MGTTNWTSQCCLVLDIRCISLVNLLAHLIINLSTYARRGLEGTSSLNLVQEVPLAKACDIVGQAHCMIRILFNKFFNNISARSASIDLCKLRNISINVSSINVSCIQNSERFYLQHDIRCNSFVTYLFR